MWSSIVEFVKGTKIPEQIDKVDAVGLFTNPWFLVPFIALVGWMIYKLAWRDLLIMAIIIGCWWVSGTEYMHTLVVGDELQVQKVLPVVFGGAAALGVIIYLLINRGD